MNVSKLCIVGEAGVGKTTLVRLLSEKQMDSVRKPTIGVESNVLNLKMMF